MGTIIDAGLYQIAFVGNAWEHHTKYQLVIVTKFESEKQTAKEIGHKAFYIIGDTHDIRKYLRTDIEEKLSLMYKQRENSKFELQTTTILRKRG